MVPSLTVPWLRFIVVAVTVSLKFTTGVSGSPSVPILIIGVSIVPLKVASPDFIATLSVATTSASNVFSESSRSITGAVTSCA